MGYYIDPPSGTKLDFLQAHGRRISWLDAEAMARFADTLNELPVCLIDNGMFQAAGIAYCASEFNAFASPEDDRPKAWFAVPKTALEPYYK